MLDTPLIHFFGPDGAGKTTQVDLLIDFLGKKGVKVHKCWVRSPHTLAYIMWRLFVRIGFYRIMWNAFGVGIKIPAVDRNKLLREFWFVLEFFSVLPHIIKTNRLMSKGYKIVAERYILDTITTVAFFINDMTFLNNPLARVLIRMIPRDAVLIFVDADFEAIFERRKSLYYERLRDQRERRVKQKPVRVYGYVPNSVVEPREFIDFQRHAYRMLARSLNAYEIHSPDYSISEIFEIILGWLNIS